MVGVRKYGQYERKIEPYKQTNNHCREYDV